MLKNTLHKYLDKITQRHFSHALQLMNMAIGRATFNRQSLAIHPTSPITWEFSGFSQNGEDGIIEYLCNQLIAPNHFFIEIGASDGTENNTSLLAICKKYAGLMIEGDRNKYLLCQWIFHRMGNPYIECVHSFITLANVATLMQRSPHKNPDVFSLDIDGNDYYIVEKILQLGYRPKIWVLEYNSTFGDQQAITIPYQADFNWTKAHPTMLYWGVSIQAWQRLMQKYDYQFITVDSCGANAFFADKSAFNPEFITKVVPSLSYIENRSQLFWTKKTWQERFAVIREMPFVEV